VEFYFSRTDTTESECILFCLPYSGGGASIYRPWRGRLKPAIDVALASMPGREERLSEPLRISPPEMARAIAEQANRPYAIYGHSLGARIGFEVIRELARMGAPLPVAFYPAAALPPDVDSPITRAVLLPDDEFLATLIDQLGTPAELASSAELRSMFLPVLRHDFRWSYEYRYQQGPPLPVPIVALAGERDRAAPAAAMRGWQRMTSAGFRLRTVPGGHLFLLEEGARLCAMLAGDLLGAAVPEPGP
jgi:surfactin synthase thioesterase subunit